MLGRLTPEQLAACDELLNAAGEGLDILVAGFPPLLESHEFTAALMAVFNSLDSQFAPVQLQYMLAVAIARLARPEVPQATHAWPCSSCGTTYVACTAAVVSGEGACCSRCGVSWTHGDEAKRAEFGSAALPRRTPGAAAGIWGATAIGDPIQDAHGVLWDSTIAAQRTDADKVLDQLADKTGETASEGDAL